MSSTPRERIEADVQQALRAGDKERLATLRLLLNAIKNERIQTGDEVGEDGFVRLVQKAIKQRNESAEQYAAGGREELAQSEKREAEILGAYLPPQASEEEIRQAIEAFVGEKDLSGLAAMGAVMKAMRERFAGSADGGTISRLAREVLGS